MLAEQLAEVPPLLPAHVQPHGPVPVMVDAVPMVQRLLVGAIVTVVLLAVPQTPFGVIMAKFAVTLFAVSIITVQTPVPLHEPDHPEKVLPLSGVAVKVTEVLAATVVVQVEPQLIPPIDVVTVPLPVPNLTTEMNTPEYPERTGQT